MLSPNDSHRLIEDVKALEQAGIPFIVVDTPLIEMEGDLKFTHSCGFVGTDNIKVGEFAARYFASQLSHGNIILVRGNPSHRSSIDRENGFLKEISKYKELHLLTILTGMWEQEMAVRELSKYLKTTKTKIDAIFSVSDPVAIAISKYFDDKATTKRPLIVGVDGVSLGQKAILEGKIDATIVQAPEAMAEYALHGLTECILTKNYDDKKILTPVSLLKSNRTLEIVTNP